MPQKTDLRVTTALVEGQGTLEGVPGFDRAAAWLAGEGSLEGLSESLSAAAIDAAVRLRKVNLLTALEEGPKALRKAARAGLHKLKSAGVEVEAPPASNRSFVLGQAESNVSALAMLAPPTINSDPFVFLMWTDSDGACALLARIDEDQGLTELEHGHTSRNGGRGMVRDLKGRLSSLVEVPFAEALHLTLRALERGLDPDAGPPHEWQHFASHVPEGVMNHARLMDPLGALPDRWDADRLAESALLSSDPATWVMPVSDLALEAMEQARAEAGDLSDLAEDQREQFNQDVLARGIEQLFADPEVRELWGYRARLMAVVRRAQGEQDHASLWQNLCVAVERGVDPLELPLARLAVMTANSLSAIQSAMPEADAEAPNP